MRRYPYIQFGKPTEATYNFAEMMLQHRSQGYPNHYATRYMVGSMYFAILSLNAPLNFIVTADHPESNTIAGVYDPHRGPPGHQPTHQAEDVAEAVCWALEPQWILEHGRCYYLFRRSVGVRKLIHDAEGGIDAQTVRREGLPQDWIPEFSIEDFENTDVGFTAGIIEELVLAQEEEGI
ncbi:hypothetical protein F4604DRAFT_1922336 [Suillus subluteus]|nr:hypothetical protein F4604DRAFT_1922336 [Suillus subluteus]